MLHPGYETHKAVAWDCQWLRREGWLEGYHHEEGIDYGMSFECD